MFRIGAIYNWVTDCAASHALENSMSICEDESKAYSRLSLIDVADFRSNDENSLASWHMISRSLEHAHRCKSAGIFDANITQVELAFDKKSANTLYGL